MAPIISAILDTLDDDDSYDDDSYDDDSDYDDSDDEGIATPSCIVLAPTRELCKQVYY